MKTYASNFLLGFSTQFGHLPSNGIFFIIKLGHHTLLVALLILFAGGCHTPNPTTGSVRADVALVEPLAEIQFEYATGQRQSVESYLPGIPYSNQAAYSSLLIALTHKILGEKEAILLSHQEDVPRNSNFHFTNATAKLLETKSRHVAPHVLRCTSKMEVMVNELNAVCTFIYTFDISLGTSLYSTQWDTQLHAAKGFTHSFSNFEVLKVKPENAYLAIAGMTSGHR